MSVGSLDRDGRCDWYQAKDAAGDRAVQVVGGVDVISSAKVGGCSTTATWPLCASRSVPCRRSAPERA
jgi:hypothetical protein